MPCVARGPTTLGKRKIQARSRMTLERGADEASEAKLHRPIV